MNIESLEARLARLEERAEGMDSRIREQIAGISVSIGSLEKSRTRFGERIGKLEAEREQRVGGKGMIVGLLTGGGVIGGMAVKLFEWFGKGTQ